MYCSSFCPLTLPQFSTLPLSRGISLGYGVAFGWAARSPNLDYYILLMKGKLATSIHTFLGLRSLVRLTKATSNIILEQDLDLNQKMYGHGLSKFVAGLCFIICIASRIHLRHFILLRCLPSLFGSHVIVEVYTFFI